MLLVILVCCTDCPHTHFTQDFNSLGVGCLENARAAERQWVALMEVVVCLEAKRHDECYRGSLLKPKVDAALSAHIVLPPRSLQLCMSSDAAFLCNKS